MARAKINTISDTVSKALADGNISDVEFRLVLNKLQKFEDLKREVRAETAPQENIEELRKKIIEEGRKEALEVLSKQIRTPSR